MAVRYALNQTVQAKPAELIGHSARRELFRRDPQQGCQGGSITTCLQALQRATARERSPLVFFNKVQVENAAQRNRPGRRLSGDNEHGLGSDIRDAAPSQKVLWVWIFEAD